MPLAKNMFGCSSSQDSRRKPLSGVRGALKRVFSFSKSNKTNEAVPSSVDQSPSGVQNNDDVTLYEPRASSGGASMTLQQQLLQQQKDDVIMDVKEQPGRMAVFRKFLSATKNKMKLNNNNIKVEEGTSLQDDSEEFEHRKQEWQEELDQMSDFLILKSTEEQREEGIENPLDTAYIEDKDGLPMLKACFDVQYFKPEEIQLNVEDGYLTLFAQSLEERTVAVFKKTMIRKMEIPRYVDHKMMHCSLSPDQKVLTVEMPFHLPPQKRPVGPTVVPVLNDPSGKRKIRLAFSIGPDFAQDDISVKLDGERCLIVEASYEAEIGPYGSQVTMRQFYKKFRLPDSIHVEEVEHNLSDKGELFVDLILKEDSGFRFKVTTEIVEDVEGLEGDRSLSMRMPHETLEGLDEVTDDDDNGDDYSKSQLTRQQQPSSSSPLQLISESGSEEDDDDDDNGVEGSDDDDDDDDHKME